MLNLLFIASALSMGTPQAPAPTTPEMVILSLDGHAHWFAKKMQREFPQGTYAKVLKKLQPQPYLIPNYPSKTAPGHATLFTGTYSNEHGVTGNNIVKEPLSKYGIRSKTLGFSGSALKKNPVWIDASQNKRVTVFQAAHTFPVRGSPNKKNIFISDGYAGVEAWPRMVHMSDLPKGRLKLTKDQAIQVWFAENKLRITVDGRTSNLPKDKIQNYRTQEGAQFFLWWVEGRWNTPGFKLLVSAVSKRSFFPKDPGVFLPMFLPKANGHLYETGALGKILTPPYTAERRYLRTTLHLVEQAEEYALALQKHRGRSHLEIYYLPLPDGLLHMWAGYLMKDSPYAKSPHAATLTKLTAQLMDRIGLFIERVILAQAPEQFLLVADHGMDYITHRAHLNESLFRAGLVAAKPKGKKRVVDLPKTKVVYPLVNAYFLKANRSSYKDGLLRDNEVPAALKKARAALEKDFKATVYPASQVTEWGATDGARGGELYIDLPRGLYPTSSFHHYGELTSEVSPVGTGAHGFHPLRPEMGAAFFTLKPLKIQTHKSGGFPMSQVRKLMEAGLK